MTLLVAINKISMADTSKPREPWSMFDAIGIPRPYQQKQVMPGITFDYTGPAVEVTRLVNMGAVRLPTAAEAATYRPPA